VDHGLPEGRLREHAEAGRTEAGEDDAAPRVPRRRSGPARERDGHGGGEGRAVRGSAHHGGGSPGGRLTERGHLSKVTRLVKARGAVPSGASDGLAITARTT